ncbi:MULTISPECIES: Fur family transcriptional regulator [Zobellia]|uniref:Fur family transcriptional regulator n=1 Tax=Zobellia TaxID=112040 RepID=UPI001BFFB58C|nr:MULTISPECIES: transcriptional repressor [Zobellia]MBT9189118.1 transcriptional repressor [Zobellia russellii]MBU2976029.1 transcriptional repressor [Zobellia sp. B3R18]
MGISRRTKSVTSLLEIFEREGRALSAISLIERLKSEINKTTVYRTLERMEDEGMVHSFKGKDGLQWYAKCKGCTSLVHSDTHPHFQCQDCGKTECLNLNMAIPTVANHKVNSAEILLIGQCQDCLS